MQFFQYDQVERKIIEKIIFYYKDNFLYLLPTKNHFHIIANEFFQIPHDMKTYFPFTGPSFWGLINPQWSLCSKGRRQSPINIEPDKLLFDPHLRPIHVDKHKVTTFTLAFIAMPDFSHNEIKITPVINLT